MDGAGSERLRSDPGRVPLVVMISIATLLFATGLQLSDPRERTRPLAEFPRERTEIRAWMEQHGWKSRRGSPHRFHLEGGRLRLVSRDDSVLIGTEEGMPLDPEEWPRLRFRLRVDRVPTETNLAEKSGDDAAFRLYVAFDEGGGLFSPPNTIAYTWTEDLEPETLVHSAHFRRLRYLSVGRGVTTGDPETDGWITVERDLSADYRRVFGQQGEVPDLVGIMLKCDSNDTQTSGSAWLEGLELVQRRE